MKKLLKKIKDDKELCSIYNVNTTPTQFSVGYILHVDEQAILMQAISPYGEDDGLVYCVLSDIASIEIGTEYLKDIKCLVDYNKITVKDFKCFEKGILSGLLELIKKDCHISTFEIWQDDERSVCGIISDIIDNLLKIKLINEHGHDSGYVFIEIDEISFIVVQSKDERKLSILYNNNNSI